MTFIPAKLVIFPCLLGLIFVLSCQKKEGSEPKGGGGKGRSPTAVKVQEAKRAQQPKKIELITVLNGRAQADVYPKVTGRLAAKVVAEGVAVKANDVLFRVDRNDPGESFLSTPVLSPLTGWVGRWVVNSTGEQVSPQSPVVSVVDDSSLKAVVHLPMEEWLLVNTQTVVKVVVNQRERPGKVISIARQAEALSGRGSVTIEVENANRDWRAGLTAGVIFEVDPKPRLIIPASALSLTDQGAFIFVVDGDKAKRTQVQFSMMDSDSIDILGGIEEGAKVIVGGANLLTDGSPIKVDSKPGDAS